MSTTPSALPAKHASARRRWSIAAATYLAAWWITHQYGTHEVSEKLLQEIEPPRSSEILEFDPDVRPHPRKPDEFHLFLTRGYAPCPFVVVIEEAHGEGDDNFRFRRVILWFGFQHELWKTVLYDR